MHIIRELDANFIDLFVINLNFSLKINLQVNKFRISTASCGFETVTQHPSDRAATCARYHHSSVKFDRFRSQPVFQILHFKPNP